MGRLPHSACAIALFLAPGVLTAHAQDSSESAQGPPGTLIEYAARVTLIRTDTPPAIDGDLSDDVWRDAAVIDQFTQVEPLEGGRVSERTEVRILYDEDAIYFGIRCFDSTPRGIIAKQLSRDANLGSDDRIALIIDTFHDRRNGYFFEVNPLGAKSDALVEGVRAFIRDWDGIWEAKAGIDELGWTAELAIPHKTISFDPGATTWGLQIGRTIRRINEQHRWTNIDQNRSLNDMAHAGEIEGIKNINQGVGLDVKPYFLGRYKRDGVRDRDGIEVDAGIDLFYKVTNGSTVALTVNTDFAETEVDERRINLTRFPLFFPEKRDFFLQDAGIFEFGGIRMSPLPFQSRRIGLGPSGEPIPILAGARWTGRESGLNWGLMSVQMHDDDELGNKNLSVGRATWNILDESTVGIIGTSGDPSTPGDNYVGGADLLLRDSELFGGEVVQGKFWMLGSGTSGDGGDDVSFGGRVEYPNDIVNWSVGMSQIGEEYNAALGFVPRRGIREYFGGWRYRIRPEESLLRTVDFGLRWNITTDFDDHVETSDFSIRPLEVVTNDGDEFELRVSVDRDVLDEPFNIFDDVIIPVDDYSWLRYGANFSTSSGRPVSFSGGVTAGDFYTGTRLEVSGGVEWRPSAHFFMGFGFSQNDIELPEGSFTTQIASMRADVRFTADLWWSNFLQWDNVSESMGINSRVRWIVEPGQEVFFVVNQGFDTEDARFASLSTDITTKIGLTFRF